MRNAKREAECLERLHALSPIYDEILAFLNQEQFITADLIKTIRMALDRHKLLQTILADLAKDRKLQLLEYEWNLLPVETIKVLIVTATSHKEFVFHV